MCGLRTDAFLPESELARCVRCVRWLERRAAETFESPLKCLWRRSLPWVGVSRAFVCRSTHAVDTTRSYEPHTVASTVSASLFDGELIHSAGFSGVNDRTVTPYDGVTRWTHERFAIF